MIEKSISAPVGFGVHAFVAQSVAEQVAAADILVIVPQLALTPQWSHLLPDATIISTQRWLKSPMTECKLIVVDEHHLKTFAMLVPSLRASPKPVWLVNMPIP